MEEPHGPGPAELDGRPGSVTCGTAGAAGPGAGNAAGTAPPGQRHLLRGQSATGRPLVRDVLPIAEGVRWKCGAGVPPLPPSFHLFVVSGDCWERICSKE